MKCPCCCIRETGIQGKRLSHAALCTEGMYKDFTMTKSGAQPYFLLYAYL